MPDHQAHCKQPFQRRHMYRLAIAVGATTGSAGYILGGNGRGAEEWLARVALSVAAVLLIVWVAEIRMSRQIARSEERARQQLDQVAASVTSRLDQLEYRLEARLEKAEYAEWYIAGLERKPVEEINGGRRLHSV